MRTSPCRGPLLLAGLILALGVGGCGFLRSVFGEKEGYLFEGYDTLALPGEEVAVKVRLQEGSLLRDKPDVPLRFAENGRMRATARTDGDGYASVRFTPPSPGDYVVTAEAMPGALEKMPPGPARAIVCCRQADAPLIIVDLDKTLVGAGFRTVLMSDPPPMPRSIEVMNQLARRFTVVYLTHRLDYLGPKSKGWLAAHGYPRGPVLLSDKREFLQGSGHYKAEVLGNLRRRFTGRFIGIGDKPSDIQAYLAHRAEAFLLMRIREDAGPRDLRAMASTLQSLPPNVQVVSNWDEIRQAILVGTSHSRDRFIGYLLRRADELETSKRSPEVR